MASITVKKADGATNIVFDALTGSGGEGSPAMWRQDTGAVAALPTGLRSRFALASASNGPKTARVLRGKGVFPYATQNTSTSIYSAQHQMIGEINLTIPDAIPSTERAEFVHQFLNLCQAQLTKDQAIAGFAAR
jgi:hypothetical protein